MLVGFLLPVFMGFAALSVDTAWISMSASQAQDVADAAAHAALIELRRTGETTDAQAAAQTIVDTNEVGNGVGKLHSMEFGTWARGESFEVSPDRPNAVRANIERVAGTNGVDLQFAKIWGRDQATVRGSAVAASRSLHVVLIIDITGSFKNEIGEAEKASLSFLDQLAENPGEYDKIGMAIFYHRYAHEFTPLFDLRDGAAVLAAETQWGTIDIASTSNNGYNDPDIDDGGKNPDMPREYPDERGTDHHVGLEQAREMLLNEVDPFAYRAAVLLTDGAPYALKANTIRASQGYVETRWPFWEGPVPQTVQGIKDQTVDIATDNWDDHNIHLWTVSFRVDNAFLDDATQGDGKYFFTSNAADLEPIFTEIANSLPLLLVQ